MGESGQWRRAGSSLTGTAARPSRERQRAIADAGGRGPDRSLALAARTERGVWFVEHQTGRGCAMPMATGDSLEADATPVPVRYWWLKRLGAAGVVFLLALLGLRLLWGHVAEARLQAKIAEYRAAGEPVLVEDFAHPPIPDAENGAYFLQRAGAAMSSGLERDDVILGLRDGTLGADDARAFLEAHAEPLRLVHEARARTAADWGVSLTSPVIGTLLPALAPQRALAKATCIAAHYEHALGDDAATLESLRDAMSIGRHLSAPQQFLLGSLVRFGVDALAVYALEEITPSLRVGGDADTADPRATRARVIEFMQQLLDVAPLAESWKSAMQCERMSQLDAVRWMSGARGGMRVLAGLPAPAPAIAVGSGISLMVAPAWNLDALRVMKRCGDFARAATQESWPAAQSSLSPDPERVAQDGAAEVAWMFSRILAPSFEDGLRQMYADVALRRFAATALAIRLYELDHGQRPAALAELVPAYLPAVPLDPFDPNDGPLRYLPEAPSPLLYSVGRNGVDEGGAFPVLAGGGIDTRRQDMPFFLNGDRPHMRVNPPASQPVAPATQPESTQALDYDGDVKGTQRDEGESQRQPE
jgi:hypothetical protein